MISHICKEEREQLNAKAQKRSATTLRNSEATVCNSKVTIRSLPPELFIMIIELLKIKDALNLCDALHVPEQVAVQYFFDYDQGDISIILFNIDLIMAFTPNSYDLNLKPNSYHIGFKPNSYKFLLKNKRFQTEASSDQKTSAALRTFDLEFVKNYLDEFKPDLNEALFLAASVGFTDAVKCLLSDSRVDPSARNNGPLRNAAEAGRVETVKLLLSDSRVDPLALDNEALEYAARYGHTEVLKLLLSDSRVELSDVDFDILIYEAEHGHPELVEFLKSSYSTFLET